MNEAYGYYSAGAGDEPELSYGGAVGDFTPAAASADHGNLAIGAFIWGPALFLGLLMLVMDQRAFAVAIWGAAAVLHSIIQPRVALYALIFVVPLDWAVSVLPGITTLSKMVGVLCLLVSLPRIIPSVTASRRDPIAKYAVVFLIWALISVAWAEYPRFSFIRWQSLCLAWGIMILVGVHVKSKATMRIAVMVFLASIVVAGLMIVMSGDPRSIVEGHLRAGGLSFVGETGRETSNVPARLAALGVIAALYLLITARPSVWRYGFYAGCVTLLIVSVLLLKSRNVYVGLPLAIVMGVVLLKGAGLGRRVLLSIVVGVLLGLSFLVIVKLGFLGEGVTHRFETIFEEGFDAGGRRQKWVAHLDSFLNTGMRGEGLDTMRYRAESGYKVAHNDWLSILGELGAIGFVCFLGMHIVIFRRERRIQNVWAKLWCLSSHVLLLMGGMTQNDYYNKYYGLMLGLILAMIRLHESQEVRAAEPEPEPLYHEGYRPYPAWNTGVGY